MKVLICGSRGICDKKYVYDCINNSNFDITEVISGRAHGVDRIGEEYARDHNISIKHFVPDWDQFWNVAGILRDRQMVDYSDAIIAIWDGMSKGTDFTIKYAKRLEKPIKVWVK